MKSDKPAAAEIRKHYFLPLQVVIAPKRGKRPHALTKPRNIKKNASHIADDPSVYEVRDSSGKWLIKVVENLYPAFSAKNKKAYGIQEIILESNKPGTDFSKLTLEHIVKVLQTYQERLTVLRMNRRIKYVSLFKNHGHDAGASLAHTHTQVIAMQAIPPMISENLQRVLLYQKQHHEHPLSHALKWELHERKRIIEHGTYFTSLAPYASEYAYEVWILPNRPVRSITELDSSHLHELALHLRGRLAVLESEGISYNFHLHEPIKGQPNYFYITITPRPNIRAGFELNTGLIINPISPEAAASWYLKGPDAL